MRLLGLNFVELFASDNYPPCQRMLMHHFDIKTLYNNVVGRCVETMPAVDVYMTSFPCQSFSSAGLQRGRGDARGRLVDFSLSYIEFHRPRVAFFENVANLYYKFRDDYEQIVYKLTTHFGYKVLNADKPLINTKHHGLPQNRSRVLIAAVLSSSCSPSAPPFRMPKALKSCVKLAELVGESQPGSPRQPWMQKVRDAHRSARARGFDTSKDVIVTDVGASEKFAKYMVNCMPCITADRGSTHRFYINKTRALVTTEAIEARSAQRSTLSWAPYFGRLFRGFVVAVFDVCLRPRRAPIKLQIGGLALKHLWAEYGATPVGFIQRPAGWPWDPEQVLLAERLWSQRAAVRVHDRELDIDQRLDAPNAPRAALRRLAGLRRQGLLALGYPRLGGEWLGDDGLSHFLKNASRRSTGGSTSQSMFQNQVSKK